MININEGKILLKEKYGSSTRQRIYVTPPDQTGIVVLNGSQPKDWYSWFTRIFLPHGYPDSVSKDYAAYQVWDTAQAFCSTITGTLATQEVLRGVGVGDTSATPLAATVTWVIKDGCGHLGRILFAFSHGTKLDAYSKKWRLYADTLNDAAMCIEIALPLFRNFTTFVLCISTTMKAIVGVAGGATRAALTQHHAVRGNLADVAAKDSAQETAVNLVASFTALALITSFGNSILLFMLMMVLHITFNYLAVRAVCLRTLNEPRYLEVIDAYLKQEIIKAPCEVNRTEPIIIFQMGRNLLDQKLCGFEIKFGCSLYKSGIHEAKGEYLENITKIYHNNYLLYPNLNKSKMYILLREEASVEDILLSYLHAILLSKIICKINEDPQAMNEYSSERPFAQVCRALQAASWSRRAAPHPSDTPAHYEPSLELLTYVHTIVHKEWPRFRDGLLHTGWDLSKHLLMVDEWRVTMTAANEMKSDAQSTKNDENLKNNESLTNEAPVEPGISLVDLQKKIMTEEEFALLEQFTIDPTGQSSSTLVGSSSPKLP